MIYIFNKAKMFSYMVAFTIVVTLFTFSVNIKTAEEVELIKVSSNVIENNVIY